MADQFGKGAAVKVRTGVEAPDLPGFAIGGWSGIVVDVKGKKDARNYFVEWDAQTLESMPPEYRTACEEQQLYFRMACLSAEQIENAG